MKSGEVPRCRQRRAHRRHRGRLRVRRHPHEQARFLQPIQIQGPRRTVIRPRRVMPHIIRRDRRGTRHRMIRPRRHPTRRRLRLLKIRHPGPRHGVNTQEIVEIRRRRFALGPTLGDQGDHRRQTPRTRRRRHPPLRVLRHTIKPQPGTTHCGPSRTCQRGNDHRHHQQCRESCPYSSNKSALTLGRVRSPTLRSRYSPK